MKVSVIGIFLLFSINSIAQVSVRYNEIYRPRFHFSPAKNWTNDPNGLVYLNGTYHLFYQHNPFDNVWGHMTWAHATSTDLIHWKHLPIAIQEENGIMIFSGTCIADKNNTSGFATKQGQFPMIAIYTGHIESTNQSQYLAYSLDGGITWTKYKNNPILDLHKKDFRDPKVFWYEPKKYWVMALMFPVEHQVQFYSSKNLRDWNQLSTFGPAGDTTGVWECPDLTQVPILGAAGKKKWLLQTSQNGGMQYFVGEFDGKKFINENPAGKINRPDYGPDYYAAIAYNQLPASFSPVSVGWINNWNYANDIPTTPWKGVMSLPRKMSLKKVNNEWILLQQPVEGFGKLRQTLLQLNNKPVSGTIALNANTQQCELLVTIDPETAENCGIRLASGNAHEFEIGYTVSNNQLYIDRSKTANQSFSKNFASLNRFEAKVPLHNKQLQLHIFFDNSIIEVFANDGETVLTAQIFPNKEDTGIELFSNNGKCTLLSLQLWKMKPVW